MPVYCFQVSIIFYRLLDLIYYNTGTPLQEQLVNVRLSRNTLYTTTYTCILSNGKDSSGRMDELKRTKECIVFHVKIILITNI